MPTLPSCGTGFVADVPDAYSRPPSPTARMPGSSSLASRTGASRSSSSWPGSSSGSTSSTATRCWSKPPGLHTATSTCPNRSSIAAAVSCRVEQVGAEGGGLDAWQARRGRRGSPAGGRRVRRGCPRGRSAARATGPARGRRRRWRWSSREAAAAPGRATQPRPAGRGGPARLRDPWARRPAGGHRQGGRGLDRHAVQPVPHAGRAGRRGTRRHGGGRCRAGRDGRGHGRSVGGFAWFLERTCELQAADRGYNELRARGRCRTRWRSTG